MTPALDPTPAPNPLLTADGDFRADVWRLLHAAAGWHAAGRLDRDELLQESALALLRWGPGYDPARAALGTFVSAVVGWTRGDLLRAAARRASRWHPLVADPPAPDPADDRADATAVRAAVDRLPADARELVERRFGLADAPPVRLRELAAERGVSHQAVADRLGRVLRRLAAYLGADDGPRPLPA